MSRPLQIPSPTLLTAVAAVVAIVGTSPPAHAAGLLIDESWCPTAHVEVTGTIDDTHAEIAETRRYPIISDLQDTTAQWMRSLPVGTTETPELVVDGELVAGEILAPREANALRIELATRIGEPGPLRSFGTPLFVSEPFDVTPGATIQLGLTAALPLVAQDTMRRLDVPLDWSGLPVSSVSVDMTATAESSVRAVYSPTHELAVTRAGPSEALASHRSHHVPSTIPMQIFTSASSAPVHLDLLPFRSPDSGEGHFVALLTGDPTPNEDDIVARDVVVVLDTSGSMDGQKIEQAKTALRDVLSGLRESDRFALVEFDANATSWRNDAVFADASNVQTATTWVDALVADGGTNIFDALRTGFSSFPPGADNPRYVVFLTDGEATEGNTDTEAILAMASRVNEVGARVFAFGLGNNVNTVLLDRLTESSGGDAFYVRPGEAVDAAVASFFAQISAPIMSNPTLDLSAFGVTDLHPETLPDLFAGNTVTLLGRYDVGGVAEIRLSGSSADGPIEYRYQAYLPEIATKNGQVPRVWAARALGAILQQIKLGDNDQALKDRALAIADRFGIVTDFTFYELDDVGNARMTWSDVPMDVVGDRAVGTSESIDGVRNSDAAAGEGSVHVRYAGDRVLPMFGGWFTDSSVAPESDWVDIHYASDAYFDLLSAEHALGIAGYLSTARTVRFLFRGRPLRITDPERDEQIEPMPAQIASVPRAQPPTEGGEASVVTLDAEGTPVGVPVTPIPEDAPVLEGNTVDHAEGRPRADTGRTSCSAVPGNAPVAWALLIGAGIVAVGRRRRST